MSLHAIYAVGPDGQFGGNGTLPWKRVPGDLLRFRKLTLGHYLIMGRKTFESLGRPLDGRFSIVVTRRPPRQQKTNNLIFTSNIREALSIPGYYNKTAFLIGGADLLSQYHHLCTTVHRTLISPLFEGIKPSDTTFRYPLFKEYVCTEKTIHSTHSFETWTQKHDRLE